MKLRKLFYGLFLCSLFFYLSQISSFAVPALEIESEYEQANGEKFKATLRGDEWVNYLESEDGAILVKGKDAYWYYASIHQALFSKSANLVASKYKYLIDEAPKKPLSQEKISNTPALWYKANQAKKTQNKLTKQLKSTDPFPYLGDQNLLVLLVDFDDVQIEYEDRWAEQAFGTSSRSMWAYYQEATEGKIHLVPAKENQGEENDGIVRINIGYNHPDTNGVIDERNPNLTCDAIKKAAEYVDFSAYDSNDNGVIDSNELHIMIIAAGYERSSGAISPSIWGHKWEMDPYPTIQGKIFQSYTQFGEKFHPRFYAAPDDMITIGIMCHELGHDLGLPDLYYYNNPSGLGDGLGTYSLMAYSWATVEDDRYGAVPTHFDAYCLEDLGVIEPEVLEPAELYDKVLCSSDTGEKNILKIPVNSQEYFLIENRQLSGFDQAIFRYNTPQIRKGGIAIYLVNPTLYGNENKENQEVTLLEADEGILGYSILQDTNDVNDSNALYALDNLTQQTVNKDTTPSNLSHKTNPTWFEFEVISNSENQMSIRLGLDPDLENTSYTVTYDYSYNGGTSATESTAQVKVTQSVDLSPTAEKDGYLFVGWHTDPNAQEALDQLVMGTEDITLYAIFQVDTAATNESSTEESSTEESSIQESSTDETSTQESSTEESSTKETSTEESSTGESSTEETSTQESSTEESSTGESSTEETSTQESSTEESSTGESSTEETSTQESSTESSTGESTSSNYYNSSSNKETRKPTITINTNDTTWIKIDNNWRLQRIDGSYVKNEWIFDNGQWYYLDEATNMVVGWKYINNQWYFFHSNGSMAYNTWLLLNHKWYYFHQDGTMIHDNWLFDQGHWYFFYSDGQMAYDTQISFLEKIYHLDTAGHLLP
ncbi:hypothetical protein FACS189418_0680 [Clostridia bacterium]|nr:hypothetical protein FACS189418_0680 [Clostridia bacterium]